MKQIFLKRLVIAGVVLFTVPASLLAQKDDKTKDKVKDNDRQMIIITRKGNPDDKTTIEIQGDKVKVNGKEQSGDNKDKDVSVRVQKLRGPGNTMIYRTPGAEAFGNNNWNFNFNDGDG